MPQHEEACKKRAVEIRDEILFKQPESSHLGDCPICFLPLSLDQKKSSMMACCSKLICIGCHYAKEIFELDESFEYSCPFCRKRYPKTQKEADTNRMKRVEVKDPVALCQTGVKCCHEGDFSKAFEYLTKAADLGYVEAQYQLSGLYHFGHGVEKDKKREIHHLEEAAIGGHSFARHYLGCEELEKGRLEKAAKHFIIAANLGYDPSIKMLKSFYAKGIVTKEDFAAALRAYQAAVDATKSPQREAAAEACSNMG
jgi:hypothetical protein